MKRTGPPQRRTELARGGPIRRGRPGPHRTPGELVLAASGLPPARLVVATRAPARHTGPSDATRLAVLERDEYACVCCGQSILGQWYSLQHRDARGMGGTSDPAANLPSQLITMLGTGTTGCHGRVELWLGEDGGREDSRKGYRLEEGQDPRKTAVWYVREHWAGWRRPADDGRLLDYDPADARTT